MSSLAKNPLIKRSANWLRKLSLFIRVWISLVEVRIKLALFGFASFERSPTSVSLKKSHISPRYMAHVVRRVSNFVPGALCLAQAVSAQRLLARFGYATTMRIGVKSDAGALSAHAWLLFEGSIILGGGSMLNEYQVLTDMKSTLSS